MVRVNVNLEPFVGRLRDDVCVFGCQNVWVGETLQSCFIIVRAYNITKQSTQSSLV